MNTRGLALAGVALGFGLLVFFALRWLGGSDSQPRTADEAERSGRGTPARLDESAVHAHGDARLIERLRRSGPHGFSLADELLRAQARSAR